MDSNFNVEVAKIRSLMERVEKPHTNYQAVLNEERLINEANGIKKEVTRNEIIDILEDKQLYRLSIKQVGTRSRQNVRQLKSPYNVKKRYKIPLDQQDFTPLQDKLEEWIEEETMKINNEVK